MSLSTYPMRSNEPELVAYIVHLEGAGAADFTVVEGGKGMTIARDDVGVHTITWSDNPGQFCGMGAPVFGAATVTNVDGYAVVHEEYDSTDFTLQINVLTEGQAAHDLSTDEWLTLVVYFKRTGV